MLAKFIPRLGQPIMCEVNLEWLDGWSHQENDGCVTSVVCLRGMWYLFNRELSAQDYTPVFEECSAPLVVD